MAGARVGSCRAAPEGPVWSWYGRPVARPTSATTQVGDRDRGDSAAAACSDQCAVSNGPFGCGVVVRIVGWRPRMYASPQALQEAFEIRDGAL